MPVQALSCVPKQKGDEQGNSSNPPSEIRLIRWYPRENVTCRSPCPRLVAVDAFVGKKYYDKPLSRRYKDET